jgi:hypothetical protein
MRTLIVAESFAGWLRFKNSMINGEFFLTSK